MSKQNKDDELCTEKYKFQGKTYLKVIVQKRNKNGKMVKKSSRFTKSGNRITSLRSAEATKFWLKQQLEQTVGETSHYTWRNWREKAIHEMRKDGYKESTLKTYEGTLEKWMDPSWNDKELSSFTRDDVFDYIHEYLVNKEASCWTRRNICKKVHRLFEFAVDLGEISKNPCRGVKVDVQAAEGLALTPGEVEILLTKAKTMNHDYYPHWAVALMTGMRCGELYSLRWSDIDFEAGVIRVLRQYTSKDGLHPPKRGKTRPIDLSPELSAFLTEVKKKYGLAQQKLWSWKGERQLVNEVLDGKPTGKKITKLVKVKDYVVLDDLVLPRVRSWMMGMQAKELRSFCKLIGIREIQFHDLRATHITNLLENGASISKVMRQVGHSKMTTTDGYHRLTGVKVKCLTQHLSFNPPEEELPENVVALFPKKVSN